MSCYLATYFCYPVLGLHICTRLFLAFYMNVRDWTQVVVLAENAL